MIYSQLRHRQWMSHSDRINEATHSVRVLQQLKLGIASLAFEPQNSQWNVGRVEGVGGKVRGCW